MHCHRNSDKVDAGDQLTRVRTRPLADSIQATNENLPGLSNPNGLIQKAAPGCTGTVLGSLHCAWSVPAQQPPNGLSARPRVGAVSFGPMRPVRRGGG